MESPITVPVEEAQPSPLSVSDAGRVYWWKRRLLRGIPEAHAAQVRRLFEVGLIPELVERGLFVRSWISPVRMDGCALVVEHEVIDVPLYPKEWSFEMLRDAALLVLDVNEVAAKYGYQTRDCHGYNVLFRRGRPLYVDLGSFAEIDPAGGVLWAYQEFMRSYWYPLQMWRTGGQYHGNRAMSRIGFILSEAEYLKYRHPLLRRFGEETLNRLVRQWHGVRTLPHRDLDVLRERYPAWTVSLLGGLRRSGLLSGAARTSTLRRRITALRPLVTATAWSNYQDSLQPSDDGAVTPRFEHVAQRLRELGVRSVFEVAGNQGVLARHLAATGAVERVICTDADGYAVDKGYRAARDADDSVEWALFNPFSFETSPLEKPPQERFRSEAVVALALTHHLILGRSLGVGYVLDVLGWFASRYVFIEFMPMGLTDGRTEVPVPEWYREEWFRKAFESRFELVERTQLERNRVLFVGAVREGGS